MENSGFGLVPTIKPHLSLLSFFSSRKFDERSVGNEISLFTDQNTGGLPGLRHFQRLLVFSICGDGDGFL